MNRLLILLQLLPLLSNAQYTQPRFENDTLYTSGGYKLFKGQVLHLGNGSSAAGYFRFIKFTQNTGRTDTYTLQNSSVVINKIRNLRSPADDDANIRIAGTATYQNNTRAEVEFVIHFEKAIQGADGQQPELIVPEEFRSKKPMASNPAVPSLQQTPAVETKKAAVTEEVKKASGSEDIKRMLVADEIKKLFDLYKAGALTKEEYELRKKKLLEQ